MDFPKEIQFDFEAKNNFPSSSNVYILKRYEYDSEFKNILLLRYKVMALILKSKMAAGPKHLFFVEFDIWGFRMALNSIQKLKKSLF